MHLLYLTTMPHHATIAAGTGIPGSLALTGQPQVFISYAREDQDRVRSIYQYLGANGIKAWMDETEILGGDRWELEINKAIRTSGLFLACLSEHAVNKRGFVQEELHRALKLVELFPSSDAFIVPIRLERCQLPVELEKYHWLDYYLPDGPQRLLTAILDHFRLTSPLLPDIALIKGIQWIGGGARAILREKTESINTITPDDRQWFWLARIFNPWVRHPSEMYGDACAIRFVASANKEWASIDQLAVRVSSYETIPPYYPSPSLPPRAS